jgi:hypothetical protein
VGRVPAPRRVPALIGKGTLGLGDPDTGQLEHATCCCVDEVRQLLPRDNALPMP